MSEAATQLPQTRGLLNGFHAFSDRFHALDAGQIDHRGDDLFIFGVFAEAFDERAVDLKKSAGKRFR